MSAAGVADSAARMNLLMKFIVAKSNVGISYRDLAAMERLFAASGLDWCCPAPDATHRGPAHSAREDREELPDDGGDFTGGCSVVDAGARGAADWRTHADDHRRVTVCLVAGSQSP